MKRQTRLTHEQSYAMCTHLDQNFERYKEEQPSLAAVAIELTEDLGFIITAAHVSHAVRYTNTGKWYTEDDNGEIDEGTASSAITIAKSAIRELENLIELLEDV